MAPLAEVLEKEHERMLGVRLTLDVAAQEIGQRLDQARLDLLEDLHRTVVREQPAPEPEGVCILVLRAANRGVTGVGEQRLAVDRARQLRQLVARRRPPRALTKEDIVALVVPESISVRQPLRFPQLDMVLEPSHLAAEQVGIALKYREQRTHRLPYSRAPFIRAHLFYNGHSARNHPPPPPSWPHP